MYNVTIYKNFFDSCLDSFAKVLKRCIETNLVLNFEKCHFMVEQGIVLGHVVLLALKQTTIQSIQLSHFNPFFPLIFTIASLKN